MKLHASIALFVLACTCAFASADDPRARVIWNTIHNRYTTQLNRWFEDGDFPRCIQTLRLMHALEPADYETTTDLGWMLGNIERKDEELAVYKEYRLAYPDDPEAAYPEAQFYFFKKEYDKVIPLLEPTLAKKPHANSYRILAHSYERLGKIAESKRVWDTYLILNPNDLTAKANLRRVEGKLKESK
jgi:tetratricopeptide (TPR) repeat protein